MTAYGKAPRPLLKKIDAVLVRVPDIDRGLDFYASQLGHELCWRTRDAAAVRLGDAELVLSTNHGPEADLLVDSVPEAVAAIVAAGGAVVVAPEEIDVGRVAVVTDPFGNRLVLVDLSKGTYQTDPGGFVVGVG